MNHRELKAIVLSIGIHAVVFILYFYWVYIDNVQEERPKVQKIAVGNLDIKDLQQFISSPSQELNQNNELQRPAREPQVNKEQPLKDSLKEEKQEKNLQNSDQTKEIQPIKQDSYAREVQKQASKTEKKVVQKEQHQEKSTSQTQPIKKQEASVPSFYSLMEQNLESELRELYGQDFYTLTQEDKDYLDENYRKIYEITQRNLRYPREAGRLGLQGSNRIEFYLHPNGDIVDLKVIKTSGYALFDKNSLHTIEVSYKDYPRPKKPLKIIFHIYYKIHP